MNTVESKEKLSLGMYDFEYVCDIEPVRNSDGTVYSYRPQENYKGQDTHKLIADYGEREYCLFKLDLPKCSGVYVWMFPEDDNPKYIGRAKNFNTRFSSSGYGRISPRNCYVGGQSTNCTMNSTVLEEARKGNIFRLYFLKTADFCAVEKKLIKEYQPEYNENDKK